jgi:hypothetical protein
MKILDATEFYARFPKNSNIDFLKKADVLIMPNADGSFPLEQDVFQDFSSLTGINCQFYSNDPQKPIYRLKEAYDFGNYIDFGRVVINYVPTIIVILKYLHDRKKEREKSDKPTIINFYININQGRMVEFPFNEKKDNLDEKIKNLKFELESIQNKNNNK